MHIDDFSSDELRAMLRNASIAKTALYNRDEAFKPFAGETMAMIFTKPSARTRVSFETVRLLSTVAQNLLSLPETLKHEDTVKPQMWYAAP